MPGCVMTAPVCRCCTQHDMVFCAGGSQDDHDGGASVLANGVVPVGSLQPGQHDPLQPQVLDGMQLVSTSGVWDVIAVHKQRDYTVQRCVFPQDRYQCSLCPGFCLTACLQVARLFRPWRLLPGSWRSTKSSCNSWQGQKNEVSSTLHCEIGRAHV